MEEQKATAREGLGGSGDTTTETIGWICHNAEPTEFLGYSSDIAEAVATALVLIMPRLSLG